MAPFAEITSVADVLGGLIGAAIGVLVIVYRKPIAEFATELFHIRSLEPVVRYAYVALGVIAVAIGAVSIFNP